MDETTRADEIVQRLAKDPKVAKIVADAHIYDELRNQPGWQRLYEMVRARRERWMLDISKRLVTVGAKPPSSEEIAYYQGFYQGAVYVLSHPAHAEANLERAARTAWLMTLEEETEA